MKRDGAGVDSGAVVVFIPLPDRPIGFL